ncbi:MAG: DNA repair protein RecO [Elusimicrobia bacterium]|nr:DNA repair protein RecO [Elusimicrobiota bacterium]
MIVNAPGIVLSRRAFGEYDRLCAVFTEQFGKIPARFVGVNRPKGKMKALSEPGVWGEYRLHLSARSEFAKAVGGRLISSFPGWRADLGRTFDALACLEMVDRLTPDHQPSPEKYALLGSVLSALDHAPSGWLAPAFGLRLAVMIGISLRERAPAPARSVWAALHDEDLLALPSLPYDAPAAESARRLLDEHLGAHAGRRLRAFEFRDALIKTAPQGVPA